MSEGAAEGGGGEGAPLADGQFGSVTETGDVPPTNTAQNPGSGIFAVGWYPWYISQRGSRREDDRDLARRKKKRKRDR